MGGVTWTPIGTKDHPFCGRINGNFHRIKNLVINSTENYQGLFGQIGGGASFCNLFIDSSCSISGAAFVAGIAGGATKSGVIYFMNCGNEGTITGTAENVAGIVGVSMGNVAQFNITNCYNSGNITGLKENAAICGWGAKSSILDGILNTGTVVGMDGDNSLGRGIKTFNNAYDLLGKQGSAVTAEDLASGALTYMLNGFQSDSVKWCQNIDADDVETDAFPTPDTVHHLKVYPKGELRCDTTVLPDQEYSNTYTDLVIPAHTFDDGVCEVCGTLEPGYVPMKDSVYEVSTSSQLNWIAQTVNKLSGKRIYVRLLEDIDFSEYTSQGVKIGLGGHDFQGVFDGQGHTVNISYDSKEQYTALFRFAKNAVIKNLITEGTVVSTAKYACGIVGYLVDTTKVINCVSKVDIVSDVEGDATCGGIAASADPGSAIINTAFVGFITGEKSGCNAGLIGWGADNSATTLENCFVAANLSASSKDLQSWVWDVTTRIL